MAIQLQHIRSFTLSPFTVYFSVSAIPRAAFFLLTVVFYPRVILSNSVAQQSINTRSSNRLSMEAFCCTCRGGGGGEST